MGKLTEFSTLPDMKWSGTMPERERIIKTGDFARAHWYPVRREPKGKRGKRNKESTLVQKKLNQTNRERMLADLLHLNFTAQDYFIRLSYDTQPDGIPEADNCLKNFFRRVRYFRKKNGLGELKYIYFTERGTKSGKIHHHVFITGGIDRDTLEELWGHGYANSRRLRFNNKGLVGLSKYGTKAKKQKILREHEEDTVARTWNSSKNLTRPRPNKEIFKNDYRIRAKDAAYIDAHPDDWEYIENLYPGYYVAAVEPTPKNFFTAEDKTPIPKAHFITIYLYRKDAEWNRRANDDKNRVSKPLPHKRI